jgi:molecular chaperone GrpE (heat shock protein)
MMRFILVKVRDVMGLTGAVGFSKNPILLYGRNLAGKTNLINLIRYCFVFGKSRKSYSEEKRLQQDELLLRGSRDGSAVFYFEHRNRLYKLEYNFKRRNEKVTQKVYFYESDVSSSSEEAVEREFDSAQPTATNVTKVKEKFNELGIYSDIIDTLISPSNIRNFTDAINNEMVTIPDMIAKQVSSLNKGAEKVLGNLEKLQALLVLEREGYQRRLDEMKAELAVASPIEPRIIETMFSLGSIHKAMSARLKTTEDELAKLPTKEIEIQLLKQKWAPEFKDKMEKIANVRLALQQGPEAVKLISDRDGQTKAWDAIRLMQSNFKSLPSGENVLALSEFDLSSVKQIDFALLFDPDRIKKIFQLLERARTSLNLGVRIAKNYKVNPSLGEVRSLAASYKKLEKAIKSPENKPEGTEAVVVYSEGEKQSSVYLPLQSLIENPNYIRGMNEAPSVYRTKSLSKAELDRISKEVKSKADDLERCRASLKSATEDVLEVKKLLPSLDNEERMLRNKKDQSEQNLNSMILDWRSIYKELKTTFGIELVPQDLNTVKGIRKFTASLRPIVKEVESRLVKELKSALSSAGIETPAELGLDRITSVDDLFAKQSVELTSKKGQLQKTKSWIESNIEKLKEAEDMLLTIRATETAVLVLDVLLRKVQENTNLNVMVEQIAQSIEENVRNCVEMIVPEEIVTFRHAGEGSFMVETPDGSPITHPAGSHKAVISLGVMLTLSRLFDLPLFLDEATDRFDYITLPNTFRFVDSLCKGPSGPQVCFVSYRTLNIERNQDILDVVKNWRIYLIERKDKLQKQITGVSDVRETIA